nr:radical SAM protein [Candidatus Njordarchaeum guaymaensis]
MKVLVAGLLDLSNVDYPKRPAAVIFTPRCNYNCSFCQNWQILEVKPEYEKNIEQVYRFIDNAAPTVEAVKVTGGEPTLYPEFLEEVSNYCHKKGLLFGFDTNGFLYEVVRKLITHSDLISLDLKTSPIDSILMEKLIGLRGKGKEATDNTMKSLEELMKHDEVYVDLRTTVVPSLNDSVEAFGEIGETLRSVGYESRALERTAGYTLQEFVPENARDQSMREIRAPTPKQLGELARATGLEDVYVKHRDVGFMVHKNELSPLIKKVEK